MLNIPRLIFYLIKIQEHLKFWIHIFSKTQFSFAVWLVWLEYVFPRATNMFFSLVNLLLLEILILDWDNDRPRNWKERRDKWAECPYRFRMLEAPYCYRHWRYFVNQDLWYSRSITDNSQSELPKLGLTGYAPMSGIERPSHRRRSQIWLHYFNDNFEAVAVHTSTS
jgi:hypothetical protein